MLSSIGVNELRRSCASSVRAIILFRLQRLTRITGDAIVSGSNCIIAENDSLKSFGDKTADLFTTKKDDVADAASDAKESTVDTAHTMGDKMENTKDKAGDMANKTGAKVGDAVDKTKETTGNAWDKTKEAAGDAYDATNKKRIETSEKVFG